MAAPRWILRCPAHVLNGIGVALGIALIQWAIGAGAGLGVALTASGGALFASLADVPLVPGRTWRRVTAAAVVGVVTTVIVMALRVSPAVLGVVTAVIAFVASFALAWGPRAGPLSFVPIIVIVFTMAAPPVHDLGAIAAHAGWTALGGLLYVAWSYAMSALLRQRYRTLALVGALDATAALLRSRQALLEEDPRAPRSAPPLQAWIARQVVLDERLQAARDQLFIATRDARVTRLIAMLLLVVDLRDTLLATELDLDLFGHDEPALRLRAALAARLGAAARAIDAFAGALRDGEHPLAPAPLAGSPDDIPVDDFVAGSAQARLAGALRARAAHMIDDQERMRALFGDAPVHVPLSQEQLRLFVSPEGWPLAALRPHLSWQSPVLRHALRSAVALGCAYFIALALPWGSHPHWLVLSVAVVLRGNLEQTLSRRNARVVGTAIGCVVVLLIAQSGLLWLSTVAFIAAVGVAHAFATAQYLVTSAAASVMALLQAHLVHPSGGLGAVERLADTVLGAALAWGFSYVLPSWERRNLPRLADRVLASLDALATQVLRWPEPGSAEVALRLARREVYEAIGTIAATARRTGAEPENVRVPLYALATLLTRCHVLLAQLAAVRNLLNRVATDLPREEAESLLRDAAHRMRASLAVSGLPPGGSPRAVQEPTVDVAIDNAPPPERGNSEAAPSRNDLDNLEPPVEAMPLPWLRRRLKLADQAAERVAAASAAAKALTRI